MKHILVTTDFSEEAARAFSAARLQAQQIGSDNVRLTLLTVIEPPAWPFSEGVSFTPQQYETLVEETESEANRVLEELAAREFNGLQVATVVLRRMRSIDQEITAFAAENNVELIVISTHGRSGFRHLLLGSVAEKVIRSAPCQTLVVPASTAGTGTK